MKKGILVSSSPARANLLKKLGLNFSIIPSYFDEESCHFLRKSPFYPKILSMAKMDYFLSAFSLENKSFYLVTADTMIFFKNNLIGKPSSQEQAKEWLLIFRKEKIKVKTGFTFIAYEGGILKERVSGQDSASLFFRDYSEEEIDFYFSFNPPWNVAGGFAWQRGADLLVERIEGHPSTIEGLPLPSFISFLKRNKFFFNS